MKKLILPFIAFAGILASCNNNTATEPTTDTAATTTETAKVGLSVNPFDNASPEFEDAKLGIKSIKAVKLGNDSATVTIEYDVKNYELKAQTADATTKGCNNSKDGQHIHFILNNQPYTALYEPKHTFNVALDQEYYLMSFLSRSYHEAVKSKDAAQLVHFTVNKDGKLTQLDAPLAPMLFYSRPKGDYVGKENTDKVLLDYYIYNPHPEKNYQVKAKVNGRDFNLATWQPYFIENAPMGDMEVILELTDEQGTKIEGVNTKVNRTVTLATAEPVR